MRGNFDVTFAFLIENVGPADPVFPNRWRRNRNYIIYSYNLLTVTV